MIHFLRRLHLRARERRRRARTGVAEYEGADAALDDAKDLDGLRHGDEQHEGDVAGGMDRQIDYAKALRMTP